MMMTHRALLAQVPFLATLTHVSVTFSRVSPVETEAPVNLTYELSDVGGDETGHNALLTWKYPEPGDLRYGWITLVYELQYRRVTEAENWKVSFGDQSQNLPVRSPRPSFSSGIFSAPQVKPSLWETHVELLSLPSGDYVVRVRCRSKNSQLWSKWSSTMLMSIPSRPSAGAVPHDSCYGNNDRRNPVIGKPVFSFLL